MVAGEAGPVQAEFRPGGDLRVPAALHPLQHLLLDRLPDHHAALHRGEGAQVAPTQQQAATQHQASTQDQAATHTRSECNTT